MNIYEALRHDHDLQRDLIAQLVDTSGTSEKRDQLFKQLKKELADHASAEEKYFYSELMQVDMTIEKARHSVAEHKTLDDLVEKLDETAMSSSAWLATATKLKDKLEHHLDEEEQEVFQLSGKALSEQQKESLGSKFRDQRN